MVVFDGASGAISGFGIVNSGDMPRDASGVFASGATVKVSDCVITGNNIGVVFMNGCDGVITGNEIVSNVDYGIAIISSYADITNNIVTGSLRSGIVCGQSSPVIANNTIVGNRNGLECNSLFTQRIFNNIIV